jgi:uridine kinase
VGALTSPAARRRDVLAEMARAIAAIDCAHPLRVGIDGPSTAGKTTLADELVAPLEARGLVVIRASGDGFHRPRAVRHRRGEISAEGYYSDSFDVEAVRGQLLEPLGDGGTRWYRRATFDALTDQPRDEPLERAAVDAVLLFDGVFLFRPELNDLWDFRIFVDVGWAEVVRRARERDGRLLGSPDAAEERYRLRYIPGELMYFTDVRPKELADVVIENSDVDSPSLAFARSPD